MRLAISSLLSKSSASMCSTSLTRCWSNHTLSNGPSARRPSQHVALLPQLKTCMHMHASHGDQRSQHSSQQLGSMQQCRSSSHASASTSGQEPSGQPKKSSLMTLPTMLTLGRVAAVPALIAAWYWDHPMSTATVTGLFIAASITDWLDGYLARKMNASSPFGAFLDPVADKLMVGAVCVLLSTRPMAAGPLAGNDWLIPLATLAIIGREITMSALREWAATLGPQARGAVAVNSLGKWKTATQMVSLTLLLAARDGGSGPLVQAAAVAGPALLVVATYLTVHSLAVYMKGMVKFMH